MPEIVRSFAPIADRDSRLVILGTLPSRLSILRNEYYGNPQNAFWRIMGSILDSDLGKASYERRTSILLGQGVALWDVLRQGRREESSDGTIIEPVANDLASFLQGHPRMTHVLFNGRKSFQLFLKLFRDDRGIRNDLGLMVMPSTSPANAMPFDEKLERWSVIKDVIADWGKGSSLRHGRSDQWPRSPT